MMNQPLSTEELYRMIEGLYQQIETLSHEKLELELLLEISTEHGDFIINHLLKLLKQYEIEKIQQKKIEIKLRSELATVMKDKADLEILLEATVEHGDTVEEELHNRSIRDPLTGLFNRRYLEQFLVRAMNEAEAENYPIAMIMIDIDHFKNFNNTLGHDAGDIVLKKVSEFLIQNISSADIACRYGGEGLTLILPQAVPEETYNQAEKIRQGVKQLQLILSN